MGASLQNQLSGLIVSQRQERQSWSLPGSDLGPLHIYYDCVTCSYGTPNSGNWGCL